MDWSLAVIRLNVLTRTRVHKSSSVMYVCTLLQYCVHIWPNQLVLCSNMGKYRQDVLFTSSHSLHAQHYHWHWLSPHALRLADRHPVSAATHDNWVHAQFIHCHLHYAWPSPSSCAGSLPQRSHTALALCSCDCGELQAELQSSHPEGEKECKSGLLHKPRKTLSITKHQHSTVTFYFICVGASFYSMAKRIM